jgi:co-chaperonin GroES (HSP10)
MAKRLIPLLDRVLVEKIVAPTKSVGGIILPESAVSKVRLQEPHGTIAQSAPTNRRPKPPPSVHPTLTFPRLTSIVSAD